jgi:uncharacterized protein YfaS (alpha-2-macroglobulin family)
MGLMAGLAGCGPQNAGPENRVLLLRQSPAPDAVLVNRDSLTWEWSDAMQLDGGNWAPASNLVTVLPPVPGTLYWRAPSVLVFTPDNLWPAVTNFRVRVDLPPSAAGRPFRPAEFTYRGLPPLPEDNSMQVRSVDPEEDNDEVSVRVVFSQPPGEGWNRFVRISPATNPVCESGSIPTARIRGLTPGVRTELTFLPGLPAGNGNVLTQELTVAVQMPDRSTRLRFRDKGHYLSSAGSRKLVLETVNVKAVTVSVWKIYANNIAHHAQAWDLYDDQSGSWLWNRADQDGDEITNRLVRIGAERNEARETILDLGDLTGGAESGLFYVMVRDADESRSREAHKPVILTDLGLTVIRNEREVLVWAMSIKNGTPVPGVAVTAYSSKKQPVGSAVTDEKGVARFGREPLPDLSLVTGIKGDSFALLDLNESQIQGVVGEEAGPFLESGYEAFLYADRGIYRPGETAHIRALVRGPRLACPASFPVQAVIRRPDGVIATRLAALLSDNGTAEFAWACPAEALTGRYTIDLEAAGSNSVGSMSLMIEDFVPPTLTATVKVPEGRLFALSNAIHGVVEARHLFGSPAAGQMAAIRLRFGSAPFQPGGYPGYAFGDPRRPLIWRTVEGGIMPLDAEGRAEIEEVVPPGFKPAAALSCTLVASVTEPSGRACPAAVVFPVDVYPAYLGLKPQADGWTTRAPVRFNAVNVTPDGQPAEPAPLAWTVSRIRWIWREEMDPVSGNRYRYDRTTEPVRDGVAEPGTNGIAEIVWDQTLEGEFELVVTDAGGAATACTEFYVSDGFGWGEAGFRQPDSVTLRPDRTSYRPGEEASITLQSPFAGTALVSLENGRIRETLLLALDGTSHAFKIPIKPEYWPNIYVRAVVVRPQDGLPPGPARPVVRAVGHVSLRVTRPEAALRVALSVPEQLKPLSPLTAEVTVTDDQGRPVACEVTLAAVDEGILQLTGYKTPDPLASFGAPRGLTAWLHDGYSLLLPDPEALAAAARLKTGGDAMGAEMAGRLNPVRTRRFVPVSLWSGTLKTGPDGRAVVTLPVPEFAGQLRVTAVAAGSSAFGGDAKAVKVRRDWVVQTGLPRAAAPGDRITMTCQAFNESAAAGAADLEVTTSGAMTGGPVRERVALAPGENRRLAIPLAAGGVGVGRVRLAVRTEGDSWEEEVEIPVRPASPRLTLSGTGALRPGREARIEVPGEWISNWGTSRLVCSGSPGLESLGALDFLDEYPHGCLEQTLSKAFPYLVAEELLAAAGKGYREPALIRERVATGIRRVLTMQSSGGGFSLWPREAEIYDWGTAYALLFLARAREAGYAVPADAIDRAAAHLEQRLAVWLRDEIPRHDYAATALTALGAAGRPDLASLSRLLRDADELDTDTQAWLIQALLASGRRAEALPWLERLTPANPAGPYRETGGALSSPVRADSLLLDAWLQVDPDSPNVPLLVNRLLQARRGGSWDTTQDNAWALLALGRYARHRPPGDATCSAVALAGNHRDTWTLSETSELAFPEPQGLRSLTLRNTGDKVMFFSWFAAGVPTGGSVPKEEDKGLRFRRTLIGMDGKPLAGKTFRQGDLAIVKLTLDELEGGYDNLVIEEVLPGGLELENPSLPGGYQSLIPEDENRLSVRYLTLRDDRLIAFTGPVVAGHLYYLVRAVTPGSYTWPPASISCMYDPEIMSLNGGGRLTVEP